VLDSLHIFKSRIRREVLTLFFTNPSEGYYLRELSRLLNCSAGSLTRELSSLHRDGLLLKETRGNLTIYSANPSHPLFKEIKSIIAKTVGVVGSLKKALTAVPGIRAAFIYGSFAASSENSASDIDVFIIGETDFGALARVLRGIQERLRREINPTVYSSAEYFRRKSERGSFMTEVLSRKKVMLIGTENDL